MSKITDIGAAYDPQFERVSDTPRTDEQYNREKQYRSITKVKMSSHGFDAMTILCKELERELVAEKEWVRQSTNSNARLEKFLAEAQAEIVRLKGEAESWEKVFDRTCEHLAEAKPDAERYRWLRERHENTVMDIYNSVSPAMIKPEMFDAAIDAAIRKGE